MLQSKVLAVAFILLLGNIFTEIGAKAISKRHVRRDWLIIPDTIAFQVYELMNKVSPSTATFLAEVAQTPIILETRNFMIKVTSKISVAAEQFIEEVSALWGGGKERDPTQQ